MHLNQGFLLLQVLAVIINPPLVIHVLCFKLVVSFMESLSGGLGAQRESRFVGLSECSHKSDPDLV